MVGCIRHIREKGRGAVSLSYLGPLTVVTAELREPEGLSARRLERRLRRLEGTLCGQGAGRVVLPLDFPYADKLHRLRPVEILPFYRAAADVLALGWLNTHGIPPEQGRVALAGPWLCPELRGAAERLCSQVRELAIRVPEEGEWYARQLHGQYGLPETPPGINPDVTLAFGPVGGMSGPVITLYGQPDLCGLELSAPGLTLPPGCEQPFLALLWEAGALERKSLRVTNSCQTLANSGTVCYNN